MIPHSRLAELLLPALQPSLVLPFPFFGLASSVVFFFEILLNVSNIDICSIIIDYGPL